MKQGTLAVSNLTFIEPMKALPVEKLPEGNWLYGVKHDGYRSLAFKDGKEVRLVSRNSKELNYPQVLGGLKSLPTKHVVLDGEIAALTRKAALPFNSSRCSRALKASL